MTTKTLLFIFSAILSQSTYAQKETTWWYFGSKAGVSFASGSPAAVTNANSNSQSTEGVASVSNNKGDLLFYTDGNYVFNKQHAVMVNGTGLNGNNSSTQSCVIVQQPVSSNRYYIFTTDQEWGSKGLQYSIVDTSLSGGDGQVITKNTSLLSKCAEKVSATMHANKVDTWVVGHGAGDNKFFVYKLSSTGVSSPVVSSVGPTWVISGGGNAGFSKGYLKFSPDGTKLVAAVAGTQNGGGGQFRGNNGRIEIYDFDNVTGDISNPQIIDKSNIPNGAGTLSSVYGVEFSPNSRFLYVSFYIPDNDGGGPNDGNDDVWQINLNEKTAYYMAQSIYVVASGNAWGGMQLGPDGKIYIARPNSTFISCIEKPNCKEAACNYVSSAVTLSGRTCQYGIPNFITSFLSKPEFLWGINPSSLCKNAYTQFFVPDSTGFDSAKWNFDDPGTGKLNTGKGFSPYHVFSGTKTFNVFLFLYRKSSNTTCFADTGRKKVTIFSYPVPNLGRDTSICQGQEVELTVSTTNASYIWKDKSTAQAYIANTKGWHWVDVKVGGCTKRDSMYLDILPNPKFSLGKDTTFCNGDSIKLSANDGQSFLWSNGKTKSSIFTKDTGMVWVKASKGNCSASDTIRLKKAFIIPDFIIDNPAQCFRNNLFTLTDSSSYINDKRLQSIWYFYDGSSVNNSVTQRTFPNAGTYTIKMVSKNKLGCKDSISKSVKVYNQTKVNFSINDSIQCLKGNIFDFINTTKDTGKINYEWDLGDKTLAYTKDVKGKTYLKDSFYKVKLLSVTLNNCRDSLIKTAKIFPNPKAAFSMGNACNLYPIQFQYTGSKPIYAVLWDFNNENNSSIENPSKTFGSTGTKKVKLFVTDNMGCTDSLVKDVDIKQQPKADFSVKDVCENDSTIFINKSKDAKTYSWKFGDGKQQSNAKSPAHLYSIGGVSTTFNITLVADASNGCIDSTTVPATVNALPKSGFSCSYSGRRVDFKADQNNNTKYRWLFGDGDSAVGSGNISHTYNDSLKEHNVCLKVTNAADCISETCKKVGLLFGITNFKPSGFKIYPNPNAGKFTVEIDNPEKNISVEVYNLVGERVGKVEKLEEVTILDMNIARGVYIVKVINGKFVYSQKLSVYK